MRALTLLVPVVLAGCTILTDGPLQDTAPLTIDTNPGECISGTWWTRGDQESRYMHPGGNCIGCHTDRSEGPEYSMAGTVYSALDEPTDCNGVQGAEVEIIDADGRSWTTTTNAAGNFGFSKFQVSPTYPITAIVRYEGEEISMLTEQPMGNCAICHTYMGTQQAAGRIVVPSGY